MDGAKRRGKSDGTVNNDSKDLTIEHQREAWKNVQRNDKAISIAKTAISTGQLISKKSGKINSDARKIVANANIAPDGLLVVHRSIPYTTEKEERIIIPSDYLPTLVNQLHSQNNHPSKHQLKQLFDKYFFGTGVANIIEDKSNPEKHMTYEFQSNEIFKASDIMVDALTKLLDNERNKRKVS